MSGQEQYRLVERTPREIGIWSFDLAERHAGLDQCKDLLDQSELGIARNFRIPQLHDRYIIAHGLLRRVLAHYLTVHPKQLIISRTEFGKPFLPDYPQLSFNISHSASQLLIALGFGAKLGVDIERIKPRQNLQALVKRCFSEREQAYWSSLPEDRKIDAFYSIWTRKEAFVKAVGRGIALGLAQCELDPERPGLFLKIPPDCGLPKHWRVFDIDAGEESRAALAIEAFDAEIKLCRNRSTIASII